MFDVFFSYSHQDKAFVQQLAERFKADGLTTFVDEQNISWGASIPRELEEALDKSRHIICVLSPDYLSSHWGQMERYAATIDDPDGFLGKVLPILLRDVQLPRLLRPLRYLDCRGPGALDRLYPEMRHHVLRSTASKLGEVKLDRNNINADSLTPPRYVFVVGNPAAGKSTFCRELKSELDSQGISVERRSDYPFLQALFRLDLARGRSDRFSPHSTSEFRVIDPTVYDEALRMIHDELIVGGPLPGTLTIIEFSRPSYNTAFLYYTLRALIDSAIVHVDAPLNVCVARNERRKLALESRLVGAENDSDVFADEPDLHYVPPSVYDRYRYITSTSDQRLVLALMPARGYYRITNMGDDLIEYKRASRRLISQYIVPLLRKEELISDYHQRRISALADFLRLATGGDNDGLTNG